MSVAGDRVIALRSIDGQKKVAYSYGEGVYLGYRHPPNGTRGPFGVVDDEVPAAYTNPCIKLDNGSVVWGFQCWWGPVDVVTARLEGYRFETVDIDELKNPALDIDA